MCASLCSPNGQPAKQAKYMYSTLLAVSLFGCVVYASATQDREEEGCWNVTIGYVFIQEPDESSPTCTSQESQLKCDYVDCSMFHWRRSLSPLLAERTTAINIIMYKIVKDCFLYGSLILQ